MEIEINSKIYQEIENISKANGIEIKELIELALSNYATLIQHNLENREQIVSKDGMLIPSNKEFTKCLVCEKMFLKDKQDKKIASKVCYNCHEGVLYFANILKNGVNNERCGDEI